jgi:hypothetical protein
MPTKPKPLTDSLSAPACPLAGPSGQSQFRFLGCLSWRRLRTSLKCQGAISPAPAEQARVEKGGNHASAELLGSRLILERRVEQAERAIIKLHAERAKQNYEADLDVWRDLQR